MTETTSGNPQQATGGRPTGKGLTVERVFTTPGVHPYDEVVWERRDVVQTNWRSGEVIFEQRGVEFPDFWSVNASTIVTTKYFRGAVGTDVREWSLKQLIDRVVLTYARAGREHGYFASAADAEVFEHELTWLLLHQVLLVQLARCGSTSARRSKQQCSACFILAVDDTMDSILNWYREEGLIFKGGSGSGINLSRIRSSKELLSSGGTASGPGIVHARRRCQRGHHQVRGSDPSGGEDGRARRRPPRRRGVHRNEGARRRQDPRVARRRLRHGSRRQQTSSVSSTRTQTTRSASPTTSCARSNRARSSASRHGRPARSSRRSTRRRCSARSLRRPGSAQTRASSTTTRSMTGTRTLRPGGSQPRTHASRLISGLSLTKASSRLATWLPEQRSGRRSLSIRTMSRPSLTRGRGFSRPARCGTWLRGPMKFLSFGSRMVRGSGARLTTACGPRTGATSVRRNSLKTTGLCGPTTSLIAASLARRSQSPCCRRQASDAVSASFGCRRNGRQNSRTTSDGSWATDA